MTDRKVLEIWWEDGTLCMICEDKPNMVERYEGAYITSMSSPAQTEGITITQMTPVYTRMVIE